MVKLCTTVTKSYTPALDCDAIYGQSLEENVDEKKEREKIEKTQMDVSHQLVLPELAAIGEIL